MSRGYKSGKQSAGNSKAYSGVPKRYRVDQYHRDIVMARAMSDTGETWFLKGGNALIWRDPVARATKDLDLYNRESQSIQEAIKAFIDSVESNPQSIPPLDVQMRVEILGEPHQEGEREAQTLRVFIVPPHGEGQVRVNIDLVVGCCVTGIPEVRDNRSLADALGVDVNNLPQVNLYPVVDHIADKVSATMQSYSENRPSSRVKDLVDIIILSKQGTASSISFVDLFRAIESERQQRNIKPYNHGFIVPDNWTEQMYHKESKAVKGIPQKLKDAVLEVQQFLNPVIFREAQGKTWNGKNWV
ncbi:MAG: nucleotidyl transferase AbiEii/AbiGii toxin family protein [Rothia sp. (in: high G+C Gram-positive bacteria)]|uniref:nucleotidyl transferase AbiEii/AbiGii toxin family protein n=1 Tax=Rothia sp. (in: high G+C Gram-positive bacteria) TaxID=1885016 RepID=UPI0026DB48E0|nr:nucleotidyl transferase AbiEii/AbiGii toxin family protein [Rothia sp. (in: high G+C Gram-positive bacteria)]MDO4884907.1 nucleotidyl transferase AbiEii/AbiGii toxin family protein [Rothia sp. (in: high G+C Gram-positive bacteria)]